MTYNQLLQKRVAMIESGKCGGDEMVSITLSREEFEELANEVKNLRIYRERTEHDAEPTTGKPKTPGFRGALCGFYIFTDYEDQNELT